MTLGMFDIAPLAAAVSPLLMPLAQGGHSSVGSVTYNEMLAPIVVLALCVAAGVGTYFLLPSRRGNAGTRSSGGVLLLFAALVLGLLVIRWTTMYAAGGPGVYFWIFSAIALFAALRVVTHARPVYAALYFVLTVFATAGLFILLWAEFMAMALVLIYAGAILVTYVFVIMLAASTTETGVAQAAEYDAVSRDPLIASAVGFALMGVLLFVIFDRAEPITAHNPTFTYTAIKNEPSGRQVEVTGEVNAANAVVARDLVPAELSLDPAKQLEPAFSVQALGRYLFREQGVNLELAGLILTLGMIGAILIARRRVIIPGEEPAGHGAMTLTAPATPIDDNPHSIPVYGTDNPRQKAYPET
jgi:NADH-quinone oxidoreductase subunit J